jgi:hypothetical protein
MPAISVLRLHADVLLGQEGHMLSAFAGVPGCYSAKRLRTAAPRSSQEVTRIVQRTFVLPSDVGWEHRFNHLEYIGVVNDQSSSWHAAPVHRCDAPESMSSWFVHS